MYLVYFGAIGRNVLYKLPTNLFYMIVSPNSLVVIIPASCMGSPGLNPAEDMTLGKSSKSPSSTIPRCKMGNGKNIGRTDAWH